MDDCDTLNTHLVKDNCPSESSQKNVFIFVYFPKMINDGYISYLHQAGRFFFGNYKIYYNFSTKPYVVGTQKNRLIETVLLSTQNKCLDRWIRKYLHFYVPKIS